MKKTVYKITCSINNKVYIGQTSRNINIRLQEHSYNSGYVSLLTRAIQKYGEENFKIESIYYGEDYNNKERFYIEKYNSRDTSKGYNIGVGGEEPPVFYGDDNRLAIFNDDWFLETVDLIKNSKKQFKEIALMQGCHRTTVSRINLGKLRCVKTWKYPLRRTNLSTEDIQGIQWFLLNTKFSRDEIAEVFMCSISTVKAIRSGQNHFNSHFSYPLGGANIRPGLRTRGKIKLIKAELREECSDLTVVADRYDISLLRLGLINYGTIYFEEDELYPIQKCKKL